MLLECIQAGAGAAAVVATCVLASDLATPQSGLGRATPYSPVVIPIHTIEDSLCQQLLCGHPTDLVGNYLHPGDGECGNVGWRWSFNCCRTWASLSEQYLHYAIPLLLHSVLQLHYHLLSPCCSPSTPCHCVTPSPYLCSGPVNLLPIIMTDSVHTRFLMGHEECYTVEYVLYAHDVL